MFLVTSMWSYCLIRLFGPIQTPIGLLQIAYGLAKPV